MSTDRKFTVPRKRFSGRFKLPPCLPDLYPAVTAAVGAGRAK